MGPDEHELGRACGVRLCAVFVFWTAAGAVLLHAWLILMD